MSAPESIALRGVRVHNLRSIDVDLPLCMLTVVTGVSGAGKSSLLFDTLYAEAQRRYLQTFSVAIRQQLDRLDRPDADSIGDLPPAIAVSRLRPTTQGGALGAFTEIGDFLRSLVSRAGVVLCPSCAKAVQPTRVDDVVAAIGALPRGQPVTIAFPITTFSRDTPAERGPEALQDLTSWAAALRAEGLIRIQVDGVRARLDEPTLPPIGPTSNVRVLLERAEAGKIAPARLRESLETAFARGQGRLALLLDDQEQIFDRRWRCPRCDCTVVEPQPRLLDLDDPLGACPHCHGTGLAPAPARGRKKAVATSDADAPCPVCLGQRWNEQARSVRWAGKSIAELSTLSLAELSAFLNQTSHDGATVNLAEQLNRRLTVLLDLGLDYLHALRPLATLATGEWKRLQLAVALTNNLSGALYLLDEPSAGLHAGEVGKLITMLDRLRGAGNTVVVVDHHAEVIRAADHVVDLGPGAGEEGGRVVAQGSPAEIEGVADSVTGDYLSGRARIAVPTRRRQPSGWLQVEGVTINNLRDLAVGIPLGVYGAITGVSGAGKTSLVARALYPCLARLHGKKNVVEPSGMKVQGAGQITDVHLIDQEPLPRTARINPATYLRILDDIRDLFAETTEAKIRGFGPGHFSFNQPSGRCDVCQGVGTLSVDMQFLADVTTTCPECQGTRYQREIQNVKVRGLSIAEVLNLTVREAFRFFRAQRAIERRLKWLIDVGLDYLRLGQPTETFSGGESQRLKLAGHLAASRKPRCLFLLLEPSAGLHPADLEGLLDCLDGLVATGHSVFVVEHNLDMIKCADYVIDLGPGAGPAGGRVVAVGTPEEVSRTPESITGSYLRRYLPE